MPAAQRAFPYIWTTWLTKLLTGESSCEWAAWFRAHHQGWERPPNDFNFAQWQIEHTVLLSGTRRKFEDSGYDVSLEGQNAFRLQGRIATLAGQPDLIIPSNDHILIVDAKTGVERASHVAQVMVYMYALPLALEQFKDARISGEIHYPTPSSASHRAAQIAGSSTASTRSFSVLQHQTRHPGRPAPPSAASATSRPPTAQATWNANTRPWTASPTISDRSSDITDALVSWDKARRLPANPSRPSESES